jgi:hypothetical protein
MLLSTFPWYLSRIERRRRQAEAGSFSSSWTGRFAFKCADKKWPAWGEEGSGGKEREGEEMEGGKWGGGAQEGREGLG